MSLKPPQKTDKDIAIENLIAAKFNHMSQHEQKPTAQRLYNDLSHYFTNHLGKDPKATEKELNKNFATVDGVKAFFRKNPGLGLSG